MNRKPENSASQTTIVAVSCTLVAAVICVVTGFVWNRRKNRDKEVNNTLRDIPTQGNDLLCPSYDFACADIRRNAGIDQPRNMQFPQGVRCRVERNFPNLTYYYYYYYYYYYELFPFHDDFRQFGLIFLSLLRVLQIILSSTLGL